MADHLTGTGTIQPEYTHPAAQVGAGLREVRERLGLKLPEIAQRLRIRTEFLSAIEAGDLSSLPGTAYRAGFVRSYAQALGLNGEEILDRFRNAGQMGEAPKTEVQFLAPVPDRGVPKGALILIGFVIVLAGYGLWYRHTEHERRLAQSVTQVPAALQPLTTPPKVTPPADTAPAPAKPPATPSTATTTLSAQPQAPAQPASATSTPTAIVPRSAASQPATAPAAPLELQTSATAVAPAAPAATVPTASASTQATPPGAGMVITATQNSWIQVTTSNGNILFSKVLNAGDSWPVPQMAGLKMTTGNAGGTIITTNGKPGQPLGAEGVVLRGYKLTPPASNGTAASSTPAPSTGTAP